MGNYKTYASILLALTFLSFTVSIILNTGALLETDQRSVIFISSASFIAIILALHSSFRQLGAVLLTCSTLIAMTQHFVTSQIGWVIDANAIWLAYETNSDESLSILTSVPVVVKLGIFFIIFLGCVSWKSPPLGIVRRNAKRIFFYCTFILSCISGLLLLEQFGDGEAQNPTPFDPSPRPIGRALRAMQPLGILFAIKDYESDKRQLEKELKAKNYFKFDVIPLEEKASERRVYVLVIGETTRADRLSLNGYERNTTPKLSHLEVFSYPNAYSAWTYTRMAVPLILTRKPPFFFQQRFSEKSVLSAFKEAGFSTVWVSMQAPLGFHEAPVSMYSYEADKIEFLNQSDYRTKAKLDYESVNALRKNLKLIPGDIFISIHLLGSHFRYSDRYPEDFTVFQPDRKESGVVRLFAPGDKIFLSNSYDNTVLYLDHVLHGLISELKRSNTSSWLLYSSDHGEELFDDERNWSGHGQSTPRSHSVAMLFWASDKYKNSHPDLINNMLAHRNNLISTTMLFETMTDLGGLQVRGNRANNSLARPNLRYPEEITAILRSSKIAE